MPEAKSRSLRRWLLRLFAAMVVVALALVVMAILTVQHLDWVTKWTIHRLFPGVKAEMGSMKLVSATRLEVRTLSLKSSKTGEPLLALEDGSVVFSFSDIWRLRLDEVRLEKPNLIVSPDLGDALGVQPAKSSGGGASGGGSGSALGWGIRHVVVNGGHLRITRFGELSPTLDTDFSADFEDFGVGGESGEKEQLARLENITATDRNNRQFLKVADADIRFATEELFADGHIRAIRVGQGSVFVAQSLLDFLSPQPGASSAPPAASSSLLPSASGGLSVAALQLDGLHVLVANAPGVLGKVDFQIAAAMQNLGASPGSPAAAAIQEVTVTDLKVATDSEPGATLLQADEAAVKFTMEGLAGRQLEELKLRNPTIDLTPKSLSPGGGASAAAAPTTGAGAPSTPPPRWLIDRVACNYGTVRLHGFQDGALDVMARFAFDMPNFGNVGAAANAVQELTIWDAQASSGQSRAFVSLDVASVWFTLAGLLDRQHIDALQVNGGRMLVGAALQKLLTPSPASPAAPAPVAAGSSGAGFSIGALDISGVRTRIEDKRPGVTDLHFTLNTSLRNVSAGGISAGLLDEVQTVEFANIDLRSPLNPKSKILSLRSVFVRFTLADLARKHLREVVILRPSIFLSQDLFVYMERASAPADSGAKPVPITPAGAPALPEPNWAVDHLEVKFGRLVIGSGGQSDVGLPLEFESSADNVSLDNLAALQGKMVLRVRKQSRDFPDYQLAVEDAEGDLHFAYPPEKGEKNLVQKLQIAGVRWRQYRARKAWLAVTFDAQGINGEFGASAYSGYLNGGFSFFFSDDSPWIGWVAGTGVDTKSLTGVISPENFKLTGPLNFEVQLDAFRKEIDRVRGVFHLTEPGTMKIGKIDDLLANIPPGWLAIKKSSTRIALETLRDFDYTAATGDFWFVQSQGILNLDLGGPTGSRKFEVALHDDQETSNRWQQGKLGKP